MEEEFEVTEFIVVDDSLLPEDISSDLAAINDLQRQICTLIRKGPFKDEEVFEHFRAVNDAGNQYQMAVWKHFGAVQ